MARASEELARARSLIGVQVKESDLQGDVLRAAGLLGWRAYHTHDSRGSAAGFPDVVAVRRGRLLCAEPKTERGQVTAAQQAWLTDLSQVTTVEAHLWRPSDWDSIEEALR